MVVSVVSSGGNDSSCVVEPVDAGLAAVLWAGAWVAAGDFTAAGCLGRVGEFAELREISEDLAEATGWVGAVVGGAVGDWGRASWVNGLEGAERVGGRRVDWVDTKSTEMGAKVDAVGLACTKYRCKPTVNAPLSNKEPANTHTQRKGGSVCRLSVGEVGGCIEIVLQSVNLTACRNSFAGMIVAKNDAKWGIIHLQGST